MGLGHGNQGCDMLPSSREIHVSIPICNTQLWGKDTLKMRIFLFYLFCPIKNYGTRRACFCMLRGTKPFLPACRGHHLSNKSKGGIFFLFLFCSQAQAGFLASVPRKTQTCVRWVETARCHSWSCLQTCLESQYVPALVLPQSFQIRLRNQSLE